MWFVVIATSSFLFDLTLVLLNIRHLRRHADSGETDTVSYITRKSYTKMAYLLVRQLLFIALVLFLMDDLISIVTAMMSGNIWIVTLVLALAYSMIQLLATSYEAIDTFGTEARFNFNKHTPRSFARDQFVDYLVTLILVMLVSLALYALYQSLGATFILYGLILVELLLILYHTLFVIVFVPLMFELTPLNNAELETAISDLATNEGINLDSIVVLNASQKSTKMNAYFSGFGKSKKIMLFDTLLDRFTTEQLVSIVAHEIGHAKYHHMIKDLITDMIVAAIYFIIFFVLLRADVVTATGQPFVFGLLYTLIVIEFIHKLLGGVRNYLSRRHEKQADLFVKEIGLGDAMTKVMQEAATFNKGNPHPHPLFVLFKYNHPSSTERLRYLQTTSAPR